LCGTKIRGKNAVLILKYPTRQSGSALFPFVVGSLAGIYGIKVLQPVLVTLFTVMILLWQLVPSPRVGLRGSSLRSKPASIEERLDPAILDSSI